MYIVQKRQSTDFEALQLWNVRSGYPSFPFAKAVNAQQVSHFPPPIAVIIFVLKPITEAGIGEEEQEMNGSLAKKVRVVKNSSR